MVGRWVWVVRARWWRRNNKCVEGEERGRIVRLLDLEDRVTPGKGERKFRVRVENSLAMVVKHRNILVGVVKLLGILPLMDCRVGCSRVV